MEFLNEVSLFKGLKEEELKEIYKNLEEKEYESGRIIFEEGAPGNEMYIIKEGKVEVRLKRGDLILVLAELKKGDFFGEFSLVSDVERSATCIAIQNSKIFSLSKENFWKIVQKNSRIGVIILKNLAEEMAERIRETNKNLETYFLINQAIIDNEQFRRLYISAKKKF
ncbi:MAG: cyclic nucleotide-binding domain-containing protein [candidate division WOR-3 bacterium]